MKTIETKIAESKGLTLYTANDILTIAPDVVIDIRANLTNSGKLSLKLNGKRISKADALSAAKCALKHNHPVTFSNNDGNSFSYLGRRDFGGCDFRSVFADNFGNEIHIRANDYSHYGHVDTLEDIIAYALTQIATKSFDLDAERIRQDAMLQAIITPDALQAAIDAETEIATQNAIQPTITENFLKAKSRVAQKLSANSSSLWYVDGKRSSICHTSEVLSGYGFTTESFLRKLHAERQAEQTVSPDAQDNVQEKKHFTVFTQEQYYNRDADEPVKFNHVDIVLNDNGSISIDGHFDCKKIETAYKRFCKIMASIDANEYPDLADWLFFPAKKITPETDRFGSTTWLNEEGDFIFTDDPRESLAVDILDEDEFYIYGNFNLPETFVTAEPQNVEEKKSTTTALVPVSFYRRHEQNAERWRKGTYNLTINDERVAFENFSIVSIDATHKLNMDYHKDFLGNKAFRQGRRKIAAKKVADIYVAKERANEQDKIFPAFFKPYQSRPTGEFTIWVYLTYADGNEHHFRGEFEQYRLAQKFIEDAKAFAELNDTPCQFFTKTRDHSNDPKPVWHDPHDFSTIGNLEYVRWYPNAHIRAEEPAPEIPLTDNQKQAAHIVELLGNRIVKFAHAGDGHNGGLALHYDTFNDEKDEFGSDLSIVEVFTDQTNFILDHVNLIKGFGDNKTVTQFFFDKPAPETPQLVSKDLADALAQVIPKLLPYEHFIRLFAPKQATPPPEVDNRSARIEYLRSMIDILAQITDRDAHCLSGFVEDINHDKANGFAPTQDILDALNHDANQLADNLNELHAYRAELTKLLLPPDITDSLQRAMTFALDRYKDFCRVGQLSRAEHELKLYNICRRAKIQLAAGDDPPPPEVKLPAPFNPSVVERKELARADDLTRINRHAPDDWRITFDGKVYRVTFKGKAVANLDSLAAAKLLPPDKFFDQFKPLVDDNVSAKEQFLKDRYRELNELLDMRDELPDDSERLKTLDELIDQLKRDIAAIEFDIWELTGTPMWF